MEDCTTAQIIRPKEWSWDYSICCWSLTCPLIITVTHGSSCRNYYCGLWMVTFFFYCSLYIDWNPYVRKSISYGLLDIYSLRYNHILLLICLSYFSFGHWELFHIGSCVSLKCFHLFLLLKTTSLVSQDAPGCSCIFPDSAISPRILVSFLLGDGI